MKSKVLNLKVKDLLASASRDHPELECPGMPSQPRPYLSDKVELEHDPNGWFLKDTTSRASS